MIRWTLGVREHYPEFLRDVFSVIYWQRQDNMNIAIHYISYEQDVTCFLREAKNIRYVLDYKINVAYIIIIAFINL